MGATGRDGSILTIPASLRETVGRLYDTTFRSLTVYEKFEHAVVLAITWLIVLVVISATWHLAFGVLRLLGDDAFDPANQRIFQVVFGMIFTVIIALEFKHSLLVVLRRQESVVRVRSIVLIAMLAMVRKFIILDMSETQAAEVFALSAAVLALGSVYWLVRDQDRKIARDASSSRET
jgi:uncharacterized membrane protein (DUF373 family)